MKVKLDKTKFASMDNAFLILKENYRSDAGIKILKDVLEYTFQGCLFDVTIVDNGSNPKKDSIYVMSVYPEMSVMEKIISAILENKEVNAIKKLWESNKKWTIEIDSRIFDKTIIDLTEREMTAIMLHEVGHIISSTSIVNRISIILRYELAKASVQNKMLLRDRVFSMIMSLPILDACAGDSKKDITSIKEELKADSFVKKMGYSKELASVLNKISNIQRKTNGYSINSKMEKTANFSLEIMNDLQTRRDALMKKKLFTLRENCESPYIKSVLNEFIETVCEGSEESNSIDETRKMEFMMERAERLTNDECVMEFFGFGQKELKKIDNYEIDYIQIKINDIKNENDRMLIVSYIHSKLDLVEYYMSILQNPKLNKKYRVPHTMNDLLDKKKQLNMLREVALNFKIPMRDRGIIVQYPTGYEG